MRNNVRNNQMRALAMALAGSAVAAIAAMFVPVGMLENFTGSTGLSELIPATAAPLGDKARAMIAFGTGALTLAVLSFALLRQEKAPVVGRVPDLEDVDADAPSLKDRLARFKMPKMPWVKGDGDITELSDLPTLISRDVHPDAPPRRPLLATQDLPILDLDQAVAEPFIDAPVTAAAEVHDDAAPIEVMPDADHVDEPDHPVAVQAAVEQAADTPVESPAPTSSAASDYEPTLAEMVAQLEAAVIQRQKQLVELELVAAQLGASNPVKQAIEAQETVEGEVMPETMPQITPQTVAETARTERPPLEAVPTTALPDDDMDAALSAALATLHRMNGTTR
jgi:hypothetical protein